MIQWSDIAAPRSQQDKECLIVIGAGIKIKRRRRSIPRRKETSDLSELELLL
jgi:hypothetical protein